MPWIASAPCSAIMPNQFWFSLLDLWHHGGKFFTCSFLESGCIPEARNDDIKLEIEIKAFFFSVPVIDALKFQFVILKLFT